MHNHSHPLTARLIFIPQHLATSNGIPLPPTAPLSSTFYDLLPRRALCGGGGDGGSTGAESRSAYLEMYKGKQPDKVNPEEQRLATWTTCTLSGMPLDLPCVVDDLGNLYNKEAVVHALLTKTMPKSLSHITSIKHIIDVKLHPASSSAAAQIRFSCPVTGVLMNGKTKFIVVRPNGQGTGWAVSERALQELPSVVKEVVGVPDDGVAIDKTKDVIPLYPQGEELQARRDVVIARIEAEVAAKAAKKNKKLLKEDNNNNSGVGGSNGTDGHQEKNNSKKRKVEANGGAQELMPKNADAKVWKSLFVDKSKKKEGGGGGGANTDYMVRGGLKYVA